MLQSGVAFEKFVGLKSKMYSHLLHDNSEHKKSKSVNKNVVAAISHNEYKEVLFNKNIWDIEWTGFKVK